ncbi:MAG: hypothetical protein QFB87_05140 [Patescibacteria group bacterium]|nr:hypothetical protein [Patescibacteria group bacterium]
MPDMILNRNYDLRSIAGRVINFTKGTPVFVPPQCVKEALAIGAEGVDEKLEFLEPEKTPEIPLTLEEIKALAFEAFPELESTNKREDFTAQGLPTPTAIEALVGIKLTNQERDDLWVEYVQAKSDEK